MTQPDSPPASYGALFVGPPGSGKTSCVVALKDMCERLKRNVIVLNLDPANTKLPYDANFNVCTMINVRSVMEEYHLGPNGALMFCMDSLAECTETVTAALKPFVRDGCYFLIDCPGQVELYTHSTSIKKFIELFQRDLNVKLAVVNLVDIVLASSVPAFLGQSLMSLGTMLRLCTPHINVLSKFDLYSDLDVSFDPFNCDFEDFVCTGVPNKLHQAIVAVLTSYDLVSYTPFSVHDETAVVELIGLIDKAVGCTWML
jgi:GTPase SAR1 family protein